MTLRNTTERYGVVSQIFHWLMALAIFVMYGLGLWIEDLTYYDALYQTLPHIHESIGIILFGVLATRYAWRLTEQHPDDQDLSEWERRAAQMAHIAFYVLILLVLISGYLISTADGRPIDVFGWFQVPATLTGTGQEDLAGEIHEWVADAIMVLAALHTMAALKHHYLDGGGSLKRMLPTRTSSK